MNCRSFVPLVLAQLLIKFQNPIENPLQNATTTTTITPINDTFPDLVNNTTFERNIRSIPYSEETVNGDLDQRIKERFISPDLVSANGNCSTPILIISFYIVTNNFLPKDLITKELSSLK